MKLKKTCCFTVSVNAFINGKFLECVLMKYFHLTYVVLLQISPSYHKDTLKSACSVRKK